jgi:hypothetical protein
MGHLTFRRQAPPAMVAAARPAVEGVVEMSRRTFRRIAVLVLIVSSLGVFSIPHAEAAQTHSGVGAAIQTSFSLRTFVYNMIDFLRSLSATKEDPPPNEPGNDPVGDREGSSGNPWGRP